MLNIALNGWKGLLEFLIPRIFLVIQYTSLLNEIINITKGYGISRDTLISALSGMDAMGALMVLISILVGYNIIKFAKTAFGRDAENVLREFNGIFESIIDDDYRVTEESMNLSNKLYFVNLQELKLEEIFDELQNAFFNFIRFIHNILNTILNTGKK